MNWSKGFDGFDLNNETFVNDQIGSESHFKLCAFINDGNRLFSLSPISQVL